MGSDDLAAAISACALPGTLQDGTPYKGIATAAVIRLAADFNKAGWMVEQRALETGILPERYARNLNILSREDQIRLLGATVVVAGLGGLGGILVEILSRGGIGTLRLIDGDCFEESNLNRQLFSTLPDMGRSKAQVAKERIYRTNPSVSVSVNDTFLDEQNAGGLIRGAQVVVDCLDTLTARFVLEAAAKSSGIPLVSAAIAGETGHITTVFPADTGLTAVYGPRERVRDRGVERSLGAPPHAVSTLSALESAEVLKVLLNRSGTLRNRLLIMDLSDYTFDTVQL